MSNHNSCEIYLLKGQLFSVLYSQQEHPTTLQQFRTKIQFLKFFQRKWNGKEFEMFHKWLLNSLLAAKTEDKYKYYQELIDIVDDDKIS